MDTEKPGKLPDSLPAAESLDPVVQNRPLFFPDPQNEIH
jgi:hypothetical protein